MGLSGLGPRHSPRAFTGLPSCSPLHGHTLLGRRHLFAAGRSPLLGCQLGRAPCEDVRAQRQTAHAQPSGEPEIFPCWQARQGSAGPLVAADEAHRADDGRAIPESGHQRRAIHGNRMLRMWRGELGEMKKQAHTTSWRAVHSAGPSRRQLIKPTTEVAGLGAHWSAPRGVRWGEGLAAERPLPQRRRRRHPTAACTWSLRDEAAWRARSLGR